MKRVEKFLRGNQVIFELDCFHYLFDVGLVHASCDSWTLRFSVARACNSVPLIEEFSASRDRCGKRKEGPAGLQAPLHLAPIDETISADVSKEPG